MLDFTYIHRLHRLLRFVKEQKSEQADFFTAIDKIAIKKEEE